MILFFLVLKCYIYIILVFIVNFAYPDGLFEGDRVFGRAVSPSGNPPSIV